MPLLTIGDQFPAYQLTALIGGDLSKVDATARRLLHHYHQ